MEDLGMQWIDKYRLTLNRSRAWGSISGIKASMPLEGRGGNASRITEES